MDNKMTAEQALDAVRNVLQRTYNAAQPVCCGRPGLECCGSPVPEWSEDDEQLMSDLQPVEAYLSQALSAPRVPAGWTEDAEAVIRAHQDDANRSSDDYFENMAVIMARRIKSLAASPEPVAPDQQVIADLRAEVEALKAKAPLPIKGYTVISEDEDVIEVDGCEILDALSMLAIAEEEEPNKAWSIVATIDAARLREGGGV